MKKIIALCSMIIALGFVAGCPSGDKPAAAPATADTEAAATTDTTDAAESDGTTSDTTE